MIAMMAAGITRMGKNTITPKMLNTTSPVTIERRKARIITANRKKIPPRNIGNVHMWKLIKPCGSKCNSMAKMFVKVFVKFQVVVFPGFSTADAFL